MSAAHRGRSVRHRLDYRRPGAEASDQTGDRPPRSDRQDDRVRRRARARDLTYARGRWRAREHGRSRFDISGIGNHDDGAVGRGSRSHLVGLDDGDRRSRYSSVKPAGSAPTHLAAADEENCERATAKDTRRSGFADGFIIAAASASEADLPPQTTYWNAG